MANGSNFYQGPINTTGEAFVLPQGQSAAIFAAGIQDAQERQRAMEALRLKREQALADDNATTMGNLKIGDHWGARTSELQSEFNALNEYAIKAAQEGKNLNNDRDFLEQKNRLLTNAAATKDLQKIYEDNYREYGKNPDAFENGLEVLDSISKASLKDFTSGKFRPQALKPIYTLADAVKASNGTTSYVKANDGVTDTTKVNRSGNVGQAIASLNSAPAKYLIEKSGGDTGKYVSGFPTRTADGKTYFNTEGKPLEDTVINALATDPELPNYLKQKGYDVSSIDAIRSSALDFAKKQNQAAGTYIKNYADNLENKSTTDTTRVFTKEANERSRRDQQIQEIRLKHDQTKWAEEELTKNPDSISTNVATNVASMQTGGKVVLRPATSLSAANVGNAKTPFLPTIIYNPDTGMPAKNSSSLNVSGGQVHIKPVLSYKGLTKILDDETLKKVKAGLIFITSSALSGLFFNQSLAVAALILPRSR